MRFLDVSKQRTDGSYDILAEECFDLTPHRFVDLFTKKEHAAYFRDIGTYDSHTWIDLNTLDVHWTNKILWMSFPTGLRLTLDRQRKNISFTSIGSNQPSLIRGSWTTKPVTSTHTIVTLRQNVLLHKTPPLISIPYLLKKRVDRVFHDVHVFTKLE